MIAIIIVIKIIMRRIIIKRFRSIIIGRIIVIIVSILIKKVLQLAMPLCSLSRSIPGAIRARISLPPAS
jgi:hypothetical protein